MPLVAPMLIALPVELQTPPPTVEVRAADEPTQTTAGPDIAPGNGMAFTVRVAVAEHPVSASVKVILVVPGVRLVASVVSPGEVTPATSGLLLVHEPVPLAFDRTVDSPLQMLSTPVMAEGEVLTVTVVVAKLLQPSTVTV